MSNIEFEISNHCAPPQYTVISDIAGDIIWVGNIEDNEDGMGYVFETIAGTFSAQELRTVADKLDELNKECNNE